jgi:anti-sigma B factor antagonist
MEIKRRQGITLIKVTGQDLADPAALHRRVEAVVAGDGDRKLLVDLSEVAFMNSTQIGAVVGLHVLAYENLAVVKFVGINERITGLFKLVGVDTLLDMHYARSAAALESFGAYRPEDWADLPGEPGAGGAREPVRDEPATSDR